MNDADIVRRTVDGIEMFGATTPPPYSAELVFRVGRADEIASTAGITHLLEHLALPAGVGETVDYNGSVDNLFTRFSASGEPADVHRFLERVVRQLVELPTQRIPTERRVLLAEEASRPVSAVVTAFALRFGAAGHGLIGYDEWGLRRVKADEATHWARSRITRAAACLWASGPGSADINLHLDLPDGPSAPAPPAPEPLVEIAFPTVYRFGPPGGVLLGFVGQRNTSALSMAVELLERALRDRLRYGLGLSYDISANYLPLDLDTAHVAITADVAERDVRRWCEAALEVLDSLASSGPTEEELEHVKNARRRSDAEPYAPIGYVWWASAQHLLGASVETPSELATGRDAVTAEDIAAALEGARRSLLLYGPEPLPLPPGFAPYPIESPYRIEGRRHPRSGFIRRGELRRARLVSGPDGITLIRPDGTVVSARYDRIVVSVRYADGSRVLVTDDGFFIPVDPSEWRDGHEIVAAVDASLPPDLFVDHDPDLALRTTSVEELSATTFKRTTWIKSELRMLPDILEPGERPLALAQATRGGFAGDIGLLCATDRRLLWLHGGGAEPSDKSLFLSNAEIESIAVDRDRLDITATSGSYPLRDVGPADAARSIARALREAKGEPPDEEDLERRIAAVKELAAKTFKRTWGVSGELDGLPYRLHPGEHLLVLASATQDLFRHVLLAATDRRLLVLFETASGDLEKRSTSVSFAEMEKIEHEEKQLSIRAGTIQLEFTDVEPTGRAAAIAQIARRRPESAEG